MSEKHKKTCGNLNYFENSLLFFYAITRYISISAFASLVGVSEGIASYAVRIKFCAITAGTKKYKPGIKKKKKRMIKYCC